jgi:hypothetical protein
MLISLETVSRDGVPLYAPVDLRGQVEENIQRKLDAFAATKSAAELMQLGVFWPRIRLPVVEFQPAFFGVDRPHEPPKLRLIRGGRWGQP